jgi:excisionase family DNA binding protein
VMVTLAARSAEHDGNLAAAPNFAEMSGVLSAREAAALLGVTERTVRRAIARSELPAVKVGRAFRIERAALADYVARRRDRPQKNRRAPAPRLIPLPVPARPRWRILPASLDRFVGRERVLAQVCELVRRDDVRLLTLTGPGGVGKTRLALEIAAVAAPAFRDGVAFVSLAPVRSPELVLPTIAQTLGVQAQERPAWEGLIETLADREVLLVLDNLEQVTAAGPDCVDLLRSCRRLKLLVTSRIPLRVSGERLLVVPPLALPAVSAGRPAAVDRLAGIEAVALFLDRAQAVAADFALTPGNAVAVAAICARTDGLPLAIELAAARARALSPADLLAAMSRRLPLLRDGARDQPDRLRSMANAIAWSYDLLTPEEQTAFRRCSVFVGGFTFDAAVTVLAAPASVAGDRIAALVDQSLIQRQPGSDGASRYALLETVREFGVERLAAHAEDVDVRDAHADWCLAFAAGAAPELAGPDHVAWFNRIEAEVSNIRAAHEWLFARGDAARAMRLGTTLSWFWQSAGYFQEGRSLFARLIAMPGAAEFAEELAEALGVASSLEHHLGNLERATELADRALVIAREHGDERAIVQMLRTLGSIAVDRGDLVQAATLLTEVRTRAPAADGWWEAASASNLLAIVAFTRGDYAAALRLADDARVAWEARGDVGHVAGATATMARAAFAAGDHQRAAAHGRAVLAQLHDVEDDELTAVCFEIAAGLAQAGGRAANAVRLLAAAEAMVDRIGITRRPGYQASFDVLRESGWGALGESAFVAGWAAGEALTVAEATAEAFAAFDLALDSRAQSPESVGDTVLTAREREVLRFLAEGLSDKEIAASLGISRHTVSNHVSAVRDKLGAPSRAGAVALAVRDGLLASDR